jgi:amino acid permease
MCSLATILFLMIARRFGKGAYSRKIRQQKNLNIVTCWLILSMLSVFIDNPYYNSFPLLMIPPLSTLIGEWLGNFRKDYQSDFILIVLITGSVIILFNV